MTDYSKYVTEFSKPAPDPELRPRINWQEALGELVDTIGHYPKSSQPLLISGVYLSMTAFQPWMADRFLERIRMHPATADTADHALESLRFMQYNDNRRD